MGKRDRDPGLYDGSFGGYVVWAFGAMAFVLMFLYALPEVPA